MKADRLTKERSPHPPSEVLFRPIKKQITVRLDADVLDWLKSKGAGHISRVNEILRSVMLADLKRSTR